MSTRRASCPGGSLAEQGPGFPRYLFKLGYSAWAANKHLQLLANLSRWREREDISTGELAAVSTEGFSPSARSGRANLRTPRSLDPLLASLPQLDVIETRSRRLRDTDRQKVVDVAPVCHARRRPPP